MIKQKSFLDNLIISEILDEEDVASLKYKEKIKMFLKKSIKG